MLSLFLGLLLFEAKASEAEAPDASAAARAGKLFAEWSGTNSPGCIVAVSQNGAVVFEQGYGMANLELGVPITPASVFPVASISKQFAAMSILLLAERGQLSLEDRMEKFFPEWAGEQPVTLRHLLTHTSGLREGFTLLGMAAPREDGVSVNDAIPAMLARQRGLNFAPGSDFQYNNGAYNLLGAIVRKVSGQSLRDFAEANIFKPLGMANSHFHDDLAMLVPNRVTGYSAGKNGFRLARADGAAIGNAGLLATARDLLRWEQNFAEARVGSKALLAEMQKPAAATDWGDGSFYGHGLAIGEHRGARMIGHGGGDPGVSSYVARFPDQGLAIAVLANLDAINTMALTRSLADIYLTNLPRAASAEAPAKTLLSAEQLAGKAGLYRDTETEMIGRFFIRDGKLMASADLGEENSVELTALDSNRFIVPGTQVTIEFASPNGEELKVAGIGPKVRMSRRLAPYHLLKADLPAFAGVYASSEIETACTVALRESELMLQIPGRASSVLTPVFADAFASGSNLLKFSRGSGGAITGFVLHSSSVRGLRFERDSSEAKNPRK